MYRRLTITENFGLVTVETSAGVRATGRTVQSTLQKLDLAGLSQQADYDAVARIFDGIRPIAGANQIVEGQAGA